MKEKDSSGNEQTKRPKVTEETNQQEIRSMEYINSELIGLQINQAEALPVQSGQSLALFNDVCKLQYQISNKKSTNEKKNEVNWSDFATHSFEEVETNRNTGPELVIEIPVVKEVKSNEEEIHEEATEEETAPQEEVFDAGQYANIARDGRIVAYDEFGNEEFEVHKAVITNASSVLGSLFRDSDIISIIYNRDVVSFMIDAIYDNFPDMVDLMDIGFVDKLYDLTQRYMMEQMKRSIQKYVTNRVMVSNAITYYEMGKKYDDSVLCAVARQEIVLFTRQVFNQGTFLGASKETIQTIVAWPHLYINIEELQYSIWAWGRQQLTMEGIRVVESRIEELIRDIRIPPKQYSHKYRCLVPAEETNPDLLRSFTPSYSPNGLEF